MRFRYRRAGLRGGSVFAHAFVDELPQTGPEQDAGRRGHDHDQTDAERELHPCESALAWRTRRITTERAQMQHG